MIGFDELTTDRLLIRRFSESDLTAGYVPWLNDPAVVKYSEQRHVNHTLDSCLDYFERFREGDDLFLALVERDLGLGHVGNLTVTVDRFNGVADVAIIIGEFEARGKGYGKEAWTCITEFLLAQPRVRKVTAGTMALNVPMLRLMKAAGMVEEGRRQGQFLLDGSEVDLVMGAIRDLNVTVQPRTS